MNDSADISVIKKGEQMIVATVGRSTGGIKIAFKLHPSVENLLREWGGGLKYPITKWGRNWVTRKGMPELEAWGLAANPGVIAIEGGGFFCLDRVGAESLFEHRAFLRGDGVPSGSGEVLNMSFLRIAGSSEGSGVEFSTKGVFTPQAIQKLAEQIKMAARTLYITYMKPVDVTVMVLTQNWQEER